MRLTPTVAIVATVVAGGAALRSRDLFEPWSGLHKAWGGAMYGNIARNLVRYDPRATGFAPLTNVGPLAAREEFEYYYHYPPLLVSMVAASYRVFGVHEGSARLVPLAFSLLVMALVFAFARRFWDVRVAVAALVLVSFLPVEVYYADHVDVYGPPVVFFSGLAVFAYARWYQDRRRGDLVLTVAALALGCLTAWYAYFVVPLLIGHALLVAPRNRRPPLTVPALFVACAVLVFAGFLLHRRLLIGAGGSEVAGSLLEKFFLRSAWTDLAIPTPEGLIPVSLAGFVKHLGRDFVRLHGPMVLALVATWLVLVTRSALRRSLEDRDWFLLILLGFGALHNLAFPKLMPGHDFMSRCFAPGFAVAAAVALVTIARHVEQRFGAWSSRALVATTLAVATVSGAVLARQVPQGGVYGDGLQLWGTYVRESTTPETVVLVPGSLDRVLLYYVDRRMQGHVRTPDALRQPAVNGQPRVFALTDREVERYPDLVAALDTSAPHESWRGHRLYSLSGDGRSP